MRVVVAGKAAVTRPGGCAKLPSAGEGRGGVEREYGTQDPQEPRESREPHGAVSGGQAALAVIVVAGIGLTALLLRPDAPLTAPGRGPLGHSAGLVLLLALACLLSDPSEDLPVTTTP